MPMERLVRSTASGGLRAAAATATEVQVKPRLRGVFHQYAFFVSLASGTLVVLLAASTKASLAAAIYAVSVSALFGVSALYHRIPWATPARRRMRRSTWPSAGWRWWPRPSCSAGWAWSAGS
jgi:predicted membrane channel-forming protein YqfA (hemolysin III family)